MQNFPQTFVTTRRLVRTAMFWRCLEAASMLPGYHQKWRELQRKTNSDYYRKEKERARVYSKQKYHEDPSIRQRAKEKLRERFKFLGEFKENRGCARCNERDYRVLSFHHVEPKEKSFNIATRMSNYNWEKIKVEISKCIVLCENCHRKIEWERKAGIEEILFG